MEEKIYNKIHFLIQYPINFNNKKKYPLIIHIHGAGGRGKDIELLKGAGPVKELLKGRKLNAIVVAPQCYSDTWFDIYSQLLEFINFCIGNKNVDKQRVSLSGISMGGYTCYQLLMTMPLTFYRAIICCGGGMYWNGARIKTPVKAFHGKLDQTVYPEESEKMVKAITSGGTYAQLTIYDDLAHNVWDRVYSNNETYKWLLGE